MNTKERISLKTKISNYFSKHALQKEILRFLIVGGFATLIDMFFMGLTIYIFQPQNYPNFFNVFFGSNVEPSSISTIVGTGVGFIFGLIFNYIFSIIFVFEEKGNSKTIAGFVLFLLLSAGGLVIHIIGMYLGYDLLKINEWIVKIFLTIVVLIYNYLTRKIFIFKKAKGVTNEGEK